MYIILDTNQIKKLTANEIMQLVFNSDRDTFNAISEVIENAKIQNELSSKKKRYTRKSGEYKGL